jgi:DNA-directed RNA polymerase specialized sigma24 family protein
MSAIWKWDYPGIRLLPVSGLPHPDQGLPVLYAAHYRSLTKLAALLAASPPMAEEIVQDAFVALHRSWRRLRNDDHALLYLQRAVVRQARSGCGSHRRAGSGGGSLRRGASGPAESGTLTALRSFPAPQREALVLSYYADMPEARIARVMGIRPGAVRSHLAHGLSALEKTASHAAGGYEAAPGAA